MDINHVHEDLDQLQVQVKQSLMGGSADGESQELFSNLRVVKCWESFDKLEWFRRMRVNAWEKLEHQQRKAL